MISWRISLHSALHEGPHIIDGVQVRAVPWPVDEGDVVLLQPPSDQSGLVTEGPILKEELVAMSLVEQSQGFFEDFQVIHGMVTFWGRKKSPPPPQGPAKGPPDHDTARFLESCNAIFLFVMLNVSKLPPDSDPSRPC